jgi:hypothetical protein
MNFTDWLEEQKNRSDRVGDFAVGVSGHEAWPKHATDLEAFENFVYEFFDMSAVTVLRKAWKEFKRCKTDVSVFEARATSGAKRSKKNKETSGENSTQSANFWYGHPVLDKRFMPMKPPGRT